MEEFNDVDDQRIRAALHNVDLPFGLRERMVNRLASELETAGVRPLARVETVVERASRPMAGRLSRRFISLALAVGVVGLLFAYYQVSRPMPAERLASHCDQLLEQWITIEAGWQTPDQESQLALSILARQLKPNVPLGFQNLSGRPVAEHCRIWELLSYATNKHFYILEFSDPVRVDKLTRQLQSINRQVSGSWTLVAMQIEDRLIVVAFQGPADQYLYPTQSA